jgi:hypothetical protein
MTVGHRRGPGHRTWRVAGSAFTVVALLLLSVNAGTWLARLSAETETGHGSYRQPVSRVEIDIDDGGLVVLAPGEAGAVSFQRRLEWSGTKPTVAETWDGQVFQVTAACEAGPWRIGWDPVCSVGYTMDLPPGVTVDARNDSGGIEARDLDGEVRLTETNGSLVVTNLGGPLVLHTGSGDIAGSGLRAGRVEVQVTTGDVDLSFAAPPDRIIVEATSGNPTIEVPRGDRYRISVETSTGHQEIGVVNDPDAARTIEIRTTSGDVRLRYAS